MYTKGFVINSVAKSQTNEIANTKVPNMAHIRQNERVPQSRMLEAVKDRVRPQSVSFAEFVDSSPIKTNRWMKEINFKQMNGEPTQLLTSNQKNHSRFKFDITPIMDSSRINIHFKNQYRSKSRFEPKTTNFSISNQQEHQVDENHFDRVFNGIKKSKLYMYVASGFAASMMPESVYAASPTDYHMLIDSNVMMNLTILGLGSLALIPNVIYSYFEKLQRRYDERFFYLFADYLGDAVNVMPVRRLEKRVAATVFNERAYAKELKMHERARKPRFQRLRKVARFIFRRNKNTTTQNTQA